jgi:hypothetical protein
MGDAFYKLAGIYCLELASPNLSSVFTPIQFAFSPGGAGRAVHVLQAALEAGGPDTIVCKADFKNAFNSIRRSHLLSTLFNTPKLSPIWKLSYWAYKAPSTLLPSHAGAFLGPISSAEGVKQGDPLATCLFSNAVHPLYVNIKDVHKDIPGVTIVADVDDVNIVGPPDGVLLAFDNISLLSPPTGLTLCLPKNKVLWAHFRPLPEALASQFLSRKLTPVLGAMETLGGIIGFDREIISNWCNTVVNSHNKFFDLLLHPSLSTQTAMLLLRYSALPRLHFPS